MDQFLEMEKICSLYNFNLDALLLQTIHKLIWHAFTIKGSHYVAFKKDFGEFNVCKINHHLQQYMRN